MPGRESALTWAGELLEDHLQIEAINSPSGVTHLTLSRRRSQQPGHLPDPAAR